MQGLLWSVRPNGLQLLLFTDASGDGVPDVLPALPTDAADGVLPTAVKCNDLNFNFNSSDQKYR